MMTEQKSFFPKARSAQLREQANGHGAARSLAIGFPQLGEARHFAAACCWHAAARAAMVLG
jgi:hypothetical protein